MNPLVIANSVTLRAGITEILHSASFELCEGEFWAFLGANGSGKTVLSEILASAREPTTGEVWFSPALEPESSIQILSFESQLRLIARERRSDESWLLHGAKDPGTTVRGYLQQAAKADLPDELLDEFRIHHLLDRGLRFLSTGEIRKSILVRALISQPRLLVLDDPFDGLDIHARTELREMVCTLPERGVTVLVVVGQEADVPACATHYAHLEDGHLVYAGPRDADGQRFAAPARIPSGDDGPDTLAAIPGFGEATDATGEPIIEMNDVSVRYGTTTVLNGCTWLARGGESWQIIGPNGAGKTTLLSLVTGANPKAYGQDIRLFGKQRGTGESVWEIKRRIGQVSGDFHHAYPLRATALDAVLSGFTDTAGMFDRPTGHQVEIAMEWLALLGLTTRANARMQELSYGQQRAVLVARAVVKAPPLLIADEPCQGLDDQNSEFVLALLDRIALETPACLVYVSHNPLHRLASTRHRLTLEPGSDGSIAVVS